MGFVCKMALGVHVLVLHNDLITTHRPRHWKHAVPEFVSFASYMYLWTHTTFD